MLMVIAACRPGSDAGAIDTTRLLAAEQHPQDWPTSGRDFGKSHYSPLTQINRASASRLGIAWVYSTDTTRGLEATPIVLDGVMYTSGVAGRVYALDAATGRLLWKFEPQMDRQVTRAACCDEVNRGVAVWKGRVYVAALDGQLYALDARTGLVQWQRDTITDHGRGYTSTGAPEVAGDVVVIGNAGAEYDVRGYLSAYDLNTGELRWRFFTVPGRPDQPVEHPELVLAAKTWDPHSRWDVGGGGPAWDGMVYDPLLDLLYVGTGNANTYPRRIRSPSGGDNLFTCSILAIHAKTGKLAWYYQEVPGDQWDFDSTQPMILTRLNVGGAQRDVLLHAPKDGFFYVLDRRSGQLLAAHPFVYVNWATSIDLSSGRPIEDLATADFGSGPKLVYPASVGAHNWHPMAYDPQTALVYLAATEAGNIIQTDDSQPYRQGLTNSWVQLQYTGYISGGGASLPRAQQNLLKGHSDLAMRSYLRALDPLTGKVAWQAQSPGGWWDRAGVLATAGGIVFQGTGTGHMRLYDALTGQLLKDLDVGSTIMAAPMTYVVGGVQYVAVMAAWGGGGWSIAHPESAAYRYGNEGRIFAFRLDGSAPVRRALLPPPGPIPPPPPNVAAASTVNRGARLFAANCAICHTNMGGSAVPDLRRMSAGVHATFDQIVLGGVLKTAGMPRWDDQLRPADAGAIHAYLISEARSAYRAEQKQYGGSTGTRDASSAAF